MAPSHVTPLESQQLLQSKLEYGTFWHRVRSGLVIREAKRLGASKILDIGAGAGHLGRWMRDKYPTSEYFFDESLESLRTNLISDFGSTSSRGPVDAITDIDMVCMLDVLEHIDDDVDFLRTLHSRLRQDAIILVTVPAVRALFSSWDTALGHYRRYSRKSIRDALQEAGYEVKETSYIFPELVPMAFLRKILRRDATASAEFPDTSRLVDAIAWCVCRTSATIRRLWPIGTSLLVVAKRVTINE